MEEAALRDIITNVLTGILDPFRDHVDREFSDLKKSAQFISDCFEEQKRELERVNSDLKQVKNENRDLKTRLNTLEEKINTQDQKGKQNNIIVSGVPLQPSENIQKVVGNIFNTIKFSPVGTVEMYRINKQEGAPILIKLDSHEEKVKLIKARKMVKGLRVQLCNLAGRNNVIFFNEDLTAMNQALYKRCRDYKKESRIHTVYTRNGKIFIVKQEGESPIRIRNDIDLSNLFG